MGKLGSMMQKQKPDYGVGDRVSHIKFGEGTVREIQETPKDYEVTVEFDAAEPLWGYTVDYTADGMRVYLQHAPARGTDDAPLAYYERSKHHYLLHPETRAELEQLLTMLAQQGEDATFRYLRRSLHADGGMD